MLTGIRLRNFKCFEDLNLEKLGRINVFIGPNGSGKSSVLQALMALRQSVGGSELKLNGPYVDLGVYRDIARGGDTSRRVGIGIRFQREVGSEPLCVEYVVKFRGGEVKGRLVHNACDVQMGELAFSTLWQAEGDNASGPDVAVGRLRVSTRGQDNIGSPIEIDVKSGIPSSYDEEHQAIHALRDGIHVEIDSWRFSSVLRGFLNAQFPLGDTRIKELLPSMGLAEAAAGITSTLAYDSDSAAALLSQWMSDVTEVTMTVRLEESKQVSLLTTRNGAQVSVTNEGFGTNQLVFLLFALAIASRRTMMGIEEPEAHLHPLAISNLGDLLVKITHDRNLQLIMTTHSEYLLLNLLNNVAEGKLASDDLVVYYFERGDTRCTARRLGITERGMVEGGLPGFFDASLEAQRRHMAALTSVS